MYKTTIGLTPFNLVYEMEAVLSIECEILLLNLAIELVPSTLTKEECLLYFANLDEQCKEVMLANETPKKPIK